MLFLKTQNTMHFAINDSRNVINIKEIRIKKNH